MPIERLSLNFPFFPLLWALTPLIGSTIGIYIYCIAVSLSARDLADWGIILYWISLGICQGLFLNILVPWGYQWGLITSIAGIICSYLSGYIWVYTTSFFLQELNLSKNFYTEPGAKIFMNISNYTFDTSINHFVSFRIITSLVIFFLGGFIFGEFQVLILSLNGEKVNIYFSVFSGLIWSISHLIWSVLDFMYDRIYTQNCNQPFLGIFYDYSFLALAFFIYFFPGNFLKGLILKMFLNHEL